MRESKWKFETSSSGGGSYGNGLAISAGTGSLVFKSPAGSKLTLNYRSIGVGVGPGAHYGPRQMNLGLSTTDMLSAGTLYMLDAFNGSELTPDDLTGICTVRDASVSVAGKGVSGTAMFLGIPITSLSEELGYGWTGALFGAGSGWFLKKLLEGLWDSQDWDWPSFLKYGAKAMVAMGGFGLTSATKVAAGITGSIGLVGASNSDAVPNDDVPTGPEDLKVKVRFNAREDTPPVTLEGDVLFGLSQFDLKPAGVAVVKQAGAQIKQYASRPIVLEGHTDNWGTWDYNKDLSLKRAATVRRILVQEGYVKDAFAVGYSYDYPVDSNNTPEGRHKNRRVEIHVMESGWRPAGGK
jgi:outer membrane protein OmpA-like peptidoglycan-associated protein